MIGALINLIIYLIVLGILAWVIFYVIDALPLPDPFGRIARVVVIVVFCLILVVLLLNMIGVSDLGTLPKLNTQ